MNIYNTEVFLCVVEILFHKITCLVNWMKTIRFTRMWHGFIGRNIWRNKGSAGILPIHWRMARLDGTDGVMVLQVTGQSFVSLMFVAARLETCWKIEKISPGVISKNSFYEVLCSEGALFVCLFVLGRQQWFSSFPEWGDIPGKLL